MAVSFFSQKPCREPRAGDGRLRSGVAERAVIIRTGGLPQRTIAAFAVRNQPAIDGLSWSQGDRPVTLKIARMNAGMSAGWRDVTRLPSVTTSRSR